MWEVFCLLELRFVGLEFIFLRFLFHLEHWQRHAGN